MGCVVLVSVKFQSTLPAREATPFLKFLECTPPISIHASREGSDPFAKVHNQLTTNFNPRFPRGKRRSVIGYPLSFGLISIHASREGSDLGVAVVTAPRKISIHASREGSDKAPQNSNSRNTYFNPRFPRGKRHFMGCVVLVSVKFQSTLPAREATPFLKFLECTPPISIHASREGSDPFAKVHNQLTTNFNPRFPRGKRRSVIGYPLSFGLISIHASREGSDSIAIFMALSN